jgi:ectoine hydroxylase-related dioxygenase (phytanoyl-CoA dioxygenase family)
MSRWTELPGDDAVAGIVDAMEGTGYCVVPDVLASNEAAEIAGIILDLQAKEAREDSEAAGHTRVLHLLAKNSVFLDLLTHPLIVKVNEAYLGKDCICSTFSSNCALPGTDLTYWHCDHPYWTIAEPFQVSPPLTAHAIWCLTDMSAETGGTKFIPGSQKRGYLPKHKGNYDSEGSTPVAPAGSVIFAHGAIWHSAGHNTSPSPRVGIFTRYARSFLIPQEELRLQLAHLEDPPPLVRRLMCGEQYQPQRGFPY